MAKVMKCSMHGNNAYFCNCQTVAISHNVPVLVKSMVELLHAQTQI